MFMPIAINFNNQYIQDNLMVIHTGFTISC